MGLLKRKTNLKTITLYSTSPAYLIVDSNGIPYMTETGCGNYKAVFYSSKEEAVCNCPEGCRVVLKHINTIIGNDTVENFINNIKC